MKKYKITDIIEDEFGCEGRPEGEEPMVTILLVDDTGKQRSIRMADKLAYEKKLDIGAEMELPEEEIMTLNGKEYKVKKLLGKGKGGYSYLVTDGEKEYVLKQIHHEPCSYYQFDNKFGKSIRRCRFSRKNICFGTNRPYVVAYNCQIFADNLQDSH